MTDDSPLRCPICGQFKSRGDVEHFREDHEWDEVMDVIDEMFDL